MMISKNMSKVVNNLQGNWGFIEKFLNNPEQAIQKFNLSKDEKEALLARNINALYKLGVDKTLLMGAQSGAHSKTCGGGGNKVQ